MQLCIWMAEKVRVTLKSPFFRYRRGCIGIIAGDDFDVYSLRVKIADCLACIFSDLIRNHNHSDNTYIFGRYFAAAQSRKYNSFSLRHQVGSLIGNGFSQLFRCSDYKGLSVIERYRRIFSVRRKRHTRYAGICIAAPKMLFQRRIC